MNSQSKCKMALSPKQQKFCEFYAASGNATEAAKLAGYSAKTAQVIGAENLLKPIIQEHLKTLTQAAEDKRIATASERQQFWTNVMRGEIDDGDVPAKLSDRLKASELLGKAQADFTERKEVSGNLIVEFIDD